MSLRSRFAVTIAAVVAVAVLVASSLAWLSTRAELRDQVDASLVARLEPLLLAVDVARPAGRRPPLVDFGARGQFGRGDLVFVVLDERGNVRASVDGDPTLPITDELHELAATRTRARPMLSDISVEGDPYRLAAAPMRSGGVVLVARDLAEVHGVLSGLRRRLVLVSVLATALAAAAGWLLARRETAPLQRLAATAEHVAATRDLSVPIDARGHDEVGRLASSFDTMLGALAASLAQQQQLVADAGHELRTPLTSLTTNVEVLRRTRELGDEDRERLLDDMRHELQELTALVGELVAIAGEDRTATAVKESVRLDALVRDVAERFGRSSGRPVRVQAEPITVRAATSSVQRAVLNLLANAEKFSSAATPIEVTVGAGRIAVRDHGSGIPPEDLPRIFDRFYRSEAARSQPGSGLGLAIVKQVALAHGGSVFAEAAAGGGAVVGFVLPESAEPA